MAETNANFANIGFEKQIWDAACVLWGHIPAADYRKVIVDLVPSNGSRSTHTGGEGQIAFPRTGGGAKAEIGGDWV